MPAGLQLFYPDGSVNLDTSTGIPRYLGTTPSGIWSGEIVVPEWNTQRPWYNIVRDIVGSSPLRVDNVTVTVTGNRLSWACTPSNAYAPSVLIYGCF